MPWTVIFIILIISLISSIVITSLISYYLSKWLAKWVKNVKRIDNRKNLSPKLKEIVRIVREISHIYKIKMPEVGIYPSHEINAFATGPAGNTLIAFSSNLVNTMNPQEIRGVIGHELSHIIHYDIARILLAQGIFDMLHLILSFLIASWLFQPSEEERRNGEPNPIKIFFKIIFFHIITGIMRLIGILFIFWYTRKRELAADKRGAEIVGIDDMLAALRKLLELENKDWVVDGVDLTEDENVQQGEPNSISLLKFNPEKKKRGLLELFRTHPRLEERIARLEKLKRQRSLPGIIF